jgi:hypothetical protein
MKGLQLLSASLLALASSAEALVNLNTAERLLRGKTRPSTPLYPRAKPVYKRDVAASPFANANTTREHPFYAFSGRLIASLTVTQSLP